MPTTSKLTLCFYEFPGAIGEIEFWESQHRERIREKHLVARWYFYLIGPAEPRELLICIPLGEYTAAQESQAALQQKVRHDAEGLFGIRAFSAVKFLIFGRVSEADLHSVLGSMSLVWGPREHVAREGRSC